MAENALKEKTVPLVNGEAAIFPFGHPMRTVIQVAQGSAPTPDANEQGLFLATESGYAFTLEDGKDRRSKFLRVRRKF